MGHVMGNSTKVKRKKVSTYAHRCVVYFCLEHGAPNVQLQFSYQESEEKKKSGKAITQQRPNVVGRLTTPSKGGDETR